MHRGLPWWVSYTNTSFKVKTAKTHLYRIERMNRAQKVMRDDSSINQYRILFLHYK
jgi:hypothetical protein